MFPQDFRYFTCYYHGFRCNFHGWPQVFMASVYGHGHISTKPSSALVRSLWQYSKQIQKCVAGVAFAVEKATWTYRVPFHNNLPSFKRITAELNHLLFMISLSSRIRCRIAFRSSKSLVLSSCKQRISSKLLNRNLKKQLRTATGGWSHLATRVLKSIFGCKQSENHKFFL